MKFILSFVVLLDMINTTFAQPQVGLAFNYGNRLTFTPANEGLTSPLTISANLSLGYKVNITKSVFLLPEVNAGFIRHRLHLFHNLWSKPVMQSPSDYQFYSSGILSAGGIFNRRKVPVAVGVGSGVSYYFFYETGGGYGATWTEWALRFHMETNRDRFSPLVNVFANIQVTDWLCLGINYRYNFTPAVVGTYIYYKPDGNDVGNIRLSQRAIGLSAAVIF